MTSTATLIALIAIIPCFDEEKAVFERTFEKFALAAGILLTGGQDVTPDLGTDMYSVMGSGLSTQIGARTKEVRHAHYRVDPATLGLPRLPATTVARLERLLELRDRLGVPRDWKLVSFLEFDASGEPQATAFWEQPRPSGVPIEGPWNTALIAIETEFGVLRSFHHSHNVGLGTARWRLSATQALLAASLRDPSRTPSGRVAKVRCVDHPKFTAHHDTPILTRPAYRIDLLPIAPHASPSPEATVVDGQTGAVLFATLEPFGYGRTNQVQKTLRASVAAPYIQAAVDWARQTGVTLDREDLESAVTSEATPTSVVLDSPSSITVMSKKTRQVVLHLDRKRIASWHKDWPRRKLRRPETLDRDSFVARAARLAEVGEWQVREVAVPRIEWAREAQGGEVAVVPAPPMASVSLVPDSWTSGQSPRNELLAHFDPFDGTLVFFRLISNVGAPPRGDLLSLEECERRLREAVSPGGSLEKSVSPMWSRLFGTLQKVAAKGSLEDNLSVKCVGTVHSPLAELLAAWPDQHVTPRHVARLRLADFEHFPGEPLIDRVTGELFLSD